MAAPEPTPSSDRMRVRRGAARARYDRDVVLSILDAGMVAHLGVVGEDGPVVLPMAYAHDGEKLYLHGALANAAFRGAIGCEVCATVTIVDGLIVGRSPFHNSMRYRSVVVRGHIDEVDDEAERLRALRLVADHIVPTWDTGRVPTPGELRRTLVVSMPLVEVSAKVRDGDPTDEPGDAETDHWAGTVPIEAHWTEPEPASNLREDIEVPHAIASIIGTPTA